MLQNNLPQVPLAPRIGSCDIEKFKVIDKEGARVQTDGSPLSARQQTPVTPSIVEMDNLTPSDLFSPSKARQQRARAQDWAHIDSWLSYKYAGRTVPTFERNEETLKVLRELSTANERADEERAVLERVEREALKELDEV